MLSKKKKNVNVDIYTSSKNKKINNVDLQKFNQEYSLLTINYTDKIHDRFIVVDDREMYHLGASIKDVGNKCFGINKINEKKLIDDFIMYI